VDPAYASLQEAAHDPQAQQNGTEAEGGADMSKTKRRKRGNVGRPRKQNVDRYASGTIVRHQRGETRDEAQATVIAYRSRTVSPKDAHKDEAGFELGRAHLRGYVSKRGVEGGRRWAESIARHAKLMGYPSPFPKALDYSAVRGGSSDWQPTADNVRASTNDMMRTAMVLGEKGRVVSSACKSVCLEETDSAAWPEHMMKALSVGCEALADHYGLENEREESERRSA
jgi:hypothetical protein